METPSSVTTATAASASTEGQATGGTTASDATSDATSDTTSDANKVVACDSLQDELSGAFTAWAVASILPIIPTSITVAMQVTHR